MEPTRKERSAGPGRSQRPGRLPFSTTELLVGVGLAGLTFALGQGVNLFPWLLLAGALFVLASSGHGLLPGFGGRRRFQLTTAGNNGGGVNVVHFESIGGQESAKRELREALEFIKESARARQLGIRPLKGILLAGPPGTGKTLLAKAAATYTHSIFLAASGSEFVEMYAGVGAQRVRQLFGEARQAAHQAERDSAIVFIDELEVLGGQRGRHTSHLEYDQTLNQLLVEMDGIRADDSVRILVIGATNRPDLLDQALLRPGRFDRVVRVDLPDRAGRLRILEIHTAGKPLADDVNLDELARETFGFSGAHLESLVNEAAIFALREGRTTICQRDLLEAVEKVMMGEKLDRRPTEIEKRRIAVHELGHALISELVRPESVAAITITSRGQALGYTRQAPQDDQYLWTRGELEGQIAVCLGGSCAEQLLLHERSTGAAGDLDQASEYAKKLVWGGMSSLGLVSKELLPADKLSAAVAQVLGEAETRVQAQLARYEAFLQQQTERLLEHERIEGEQFRQSLRAWPRSRPAEPSAEEQPQVTSPTALSA